MPNSVDLLLLGSGFNSVDSKEIDKLLDFHGTGLTSEDLLLLPSKQEAEAVRDTIAGKTDDLHVKQVTSKDMSEIFGYRPSARTFF